MDLIAGVDRLISQLEVVKAVSAASSTSAKSTDFEALLAEASERLEGLGLEASSLGSEDQPSTLVYSHELELSALQKSLRGTYNVAEADDGRFTVSYPTGGLVGTYETEDQAVRMARVLEAGKASMIRSANFKVERSDEVDAELREIGFSSAEIEAAYEKQEQNVLTARDVLNKMIETEAARSPSATNASNVVAYYRARISGSADQN